MYYAIHTTKTFGKDIVSVPTLTSDNKQNAMKLFRATVKCEANEQNATTYRVMGAHAEITLEKTKSATGLIGGEVIALAIVKRPVNSSQEEIWISFAPEETMRRIYRTDPDL